MKYSILLLLLVMAIAISSSAWGQYIESVEEITAGNFFGYGARQMAMGGTGLMTDDGTSLFYNPANLARIPRIEIHFGMSHQKFDDKSYFRPIRKIVDYNNIIPSVNTYSGRFEGFTSSANSSENSKTNTRIGSAIISIPYPTYRGSFVFGIGVVRVADFDRAFRMYHKDDSAEIKAISAVGTEFQSGGLYQWGFGAGFDLSPKVSIGGTLSLYTGKHEYDWRYDLDSASIYRYHKEQFIEDKYIGLGAKIGMAVQLNQYLGLGLAIESPVSLRVEENSSDYYYISDTANTENSEFSYVEYNVKRPFVFSAGMISRIYDATLMADIDYTDWSQLAYSNNIDMEKYNDAIKDYYKDVLRFRTGGEYVFPTLGLSLRSGIFTDPLPIKEQFQNKSRWGYTFGAGLLIDQVMTIDVAYLHGSYGRNSDFPYSSVYNGDPNKSQYLVVDENVTYNRLYMTAAYRF